MYSLTNSFSIRFSLFTLCTIMFFVAGCETGGMNQNQRNNGMHNFMVMDPGHFHAALVFKRAGYESVSPDVSIYAPVGEDFTDHMARVVPFNTRQENPASWNYKIYLSPDYQERMFLDKSGDVVVLSGRNNSKMDRIAASVDAGFNVLADKPWVIEPEKLPVLESALNEAGRKGLIIQDIMTERYEITSILQKLIAAEEPVFGELTNGTPDDPAVVKKSVHHLYKLVAGRPNKRPWWFFDTAIQGEGIADVTTHLVDIIFWMLFPEAPIDYQNDVEVHKASHWPTVLDNAQFESITGRRSFPSEFTLDENGKFPYYCNGQFVFSVKGMYAQAQVEWHYQAPPGGGDTHYSIIKGTKGHIVILQGKDQNYRPELYVKAAPGNDESAVGDALTAFIKRLDGGDYPGLSVSHIGDLWRVNIPDKYRVGHEAHFGQVTDAFLNYLGGKPVPGWEKSNMMAKYYVTTKALEVCRKQQ